MAQILVKHRGPISLAYVPRGPVISGESAAVFAELATALDHTCRRHRSISLLLEPDEGSSLAEFGQEAGFCLSSRHFQPHRTVKVPLLDDEALLQQMHSKTRYNIRLAQRRGFVVDRASPNETALDAFYGLLEDTAQRNEYRIHQRSYYDNLIGALGDDAALLFVRDGSTLMGGALAAAFGDEAIYLHGASSTKHRATGATAYLHFETMRWARERGCSRYDLGGIPAHDPPAGSDADSNPASRGQDLAGMYKFKVGFGGKIVEFPAMAERDYHPLLARLAKRAIDGLGAR
jgi:lipid II:glycine glycyltransferase (peptidoglycan interpeptide bridge formation enzyme)